MAGAVAAGMSRSQLVYVGTDIHKAIDIMKSELRPGVVFLIKLALPGRDVRCNARTCNTKVSSCASCPLLDAPAAVFENPFVRRFVQ